MGFRSRSRGVRQADSRTATVILFEVEMVREARGRGGIGSGFMKDWCCQFKTCIEIGIILIYRPLKDEGLSFWHLLLRYSMTSHPSKYQQGLICLKTPWHLPALHSTKSSYRAALVCFDSRRALLWHKGQCGVVGSPA